MLSVSTLHRERRGPGYILFGRASDARDADIVGRCLASGA